MIKIYFRGWKILATTSTTIATKGEGIFAYHGSFDFEATLRATKAEINRLEGPEVWDENYTNEALR